MTIDKFKEKYSGLIARGVIEVTESPNLTIIALDRYDINSGFIATIKEIIPARNDIRRMGFTKIKSFIGVYKRETIS